MLNFLCIGAQKAGTSWLYRQLVRHRSVAFPQGKEVHYWDWVQDGKRPSNNPLYASYFQSQEDGVLLGDMTPAYAQLRETYIEQLHAMYPEVRILFILRNPVERAWSAAKMVLDFAQMSPSEAGLEWFRRVLLSESSVDRGRYEMTISRWLRYFDRSQLLILQYDDLIADPRALLLSVADFLALDPGPFRRLSELQLTTRVREGIHLSMPTELRDELYRLYKPSVHALESLLGNSLERWSDPMWVTSNRDS